MAKIFGLDRLNVYGLGSLGSALGVVGHCRALGKRAIAVADDRAVMDEHVLGVIIGRDEPKALLVAEPLHDSSCDCASSGIDLRCVGGGCLIGNSYERWHLVGAARPDPRTVAMRAAALSASERGSPARANDIDRWRGGPVTEGSAGRSVARMRTALPLRDRRPVVVAVRDSRCSSARNSGTAAWHHGQRRCPVAGTARATNEVGDTGTAAGAPNYGSVSRAPTRRSERWLEKRIERKVCAPATPRT